MRISIDADPIGPLSILTELPETPLAVLEGLNGIGKSLAIRILQICTGTIPYPEDSSVWQSLCAGLGPFSVSVSSLEGAEEIFWSGDSRKWLKAGGRTGDSVLFDERTVDGHSASLEEVRTLLTVHRIAGDESILDTFAGQADALSAMIRGASRRLTAAKNSPLAVLEEAITSTIHELGSWTVPRYNDLSQKYRDSLIDLDDARKEATQKRSTFEDTFSALELHGNIEELQAITPGIEQSIREIDEAIRKTRAKRDEIQNQVTELAGQVSEAASWLNELQNAQRTLVRNRRKLSAERAAASAAAQPLGVQPQEPDVQDLIDSAQTEHANLLIRQSDLDSTPILKTTLRAASDSLTTASNRGLGERIAVDDPETGTQLTVYQTNRGMTARLQYLDEQPPMPEVQELASELRDVERRLALATQLQVTLANVRRYERLVSENEDRVTAALDATDQDAASKLRQLEAIRRECDDQLMEFASQRAALSQRLGPIPSGATTESLMSQLESLLMRLRIDLQSLEVAGRVAQDNDRLAQETLRRSQDRASELRREIVLAQNEVRATIATVVDGTELAWLRTAIPEHLIPVETAGLDAQISSIDGIRELLTKVDDRLGSLRAQMGAIDTAFETISGNLKEKISTASHSGVDKRELYLPEAYQFLSQQFSRWLNDARIRREILPATTSEVVVDARERNVIWREGGQLRSRPLEAFSSGQQAFAYTRARLAVIDDELHRSLNRLIVLDEFGAFIAHDLLSGLLSYLVERTGKYTGDQVLVILPLSTDYQDMANRASGAEQERLQELADSVTNNNYLVRILS
jgi:archaellum component FlaC